MPSITYVNACAPSHSGASYASGSRIVRSSLLVVSLKMQPLLSGVFALHDEIAAFEAAGDRGRSMKVQLAF